MTSLIERYGGTHHASSMLMTSGFSHAFKPSSALPGKLNALEMQQ